MAIEHKPDIILMDKDEEFHKRCKDFSKAQINSVFLECCHNGNLERIKYVLHSPDLREHADIHAHYDSGFGYAAQFGHTEVVEYFIFDMNIEKTKFITANLKPKHKDKIENMFRLRDLNAKLEEDLTVSKITNKKIKL